MFKDVFKKVLESGLGLRVVDSDSYRGIRGEIFWEMRNPKTGEVRRGHMYNVVTNDASVLLARLLRSSSVAHQSEPNYGVLALALGSGDVGWDPQRPPPATPTQRSLYNEVARKVIASSSFVTPDGQVSPVPTNVVDFTTTFTESEAVGSLMEMGLIGGDASSNMSLRSPVLPANGAYDPSTSVIGKDALVNYKTFKVVNKAPGWTLSWTWRLTL